MNKPQALNAFWELFGWDAYDENFVPKSAEMPYITYNSATDAIGSVLNLSGSLWCRAQKIEENKNETIYSSGWPEIEAKTAEIADVLPAYGYYIHPVDGGYMWIQRGRPFAQRKGDPDDPGIRRMIINIQVEFLTAT